MSTTSTVRWLGLLGGLAAGCHDTSSEELMRVDSCATHRCETFYDRSPGDVPTPLKGAMFEVRDFGYACSLDVSWSSPRALAWRFHARVDAHRGSVFPLRDGLVQLEFCQGLYGQRPGHTTQPHAVLVLDPDASAWPALASDDVFIPLSGYALIDDVYVTARMDPVPDGGGASPSVSLVSWPIPPKPISYNGLHDGDPFRWGEREARIVHIVRSSLVAYARPEPVGWVEVSLLRRNLSAAE